MALILIIDDDSTIRLLLEQFLKREGHDVLLAENGKQGIDLMRKTPPDLIITDIMMPEMDGLEILIKLRKEKETVPVIAISGGMRALPINFLHQARLLGAKHVFEKPVPLEILGKAVNELLNPPTGEA